MIYKSELKKEIEFLKDVIKTNTKTYESNIKFENDRFDALCKHLGVHFENKKTVESQYNFFRPDEFKDVIISEIVVVKNKKTK